jgi:hypothetical protein
METPLIASVATGETERKKRDEARKKWTEKKENIEANKETTCLLLNTSQVIIVFTRAGYIFLLHFTKLHLIYIRVILVLSSQMLLCFLSVSSIQIYPPHLLSSVCAKFCTISASAISPQRGSSS